MALPWNIVSAFILIFWQQHPPICPVYLQPIFQKYPMCSNMGLAHVGRILATFVRTSKLDGSFILEVMLAPAACQNLRASGHAPTQEGSTIELTTKSVSAQLKLLCFRHAGGNLGFIGTNGSRVCSEERNGGR